MSRISVFFTVYLSICTNAIVVQNLGLNQATIPFQHTSNLPILQLPHSSKIITHHPAAEIISVQHPITSHLIKTSTFAPDDNKDFDLNPRYSFSYDIKDLKTGDDKQQEEKLSEGHVQGKYSLVEPDGTRRTVSYTANDLNGFNAIISKELSPLNHNIIYERQKILNIELNRKENQNLEEFQKQLAQHQIEIEEVQRRQQEEFRKSIIQQKEQLTKEQLKQTLIEQQEKLAAQKEQQRKSEQLILLQTPSLLDHHAIHSTIIHQTNTPTLNSAPFLTTNQHYSTLQTHPAFIKSFGSSKTQILSSHPTTLLQRQYFSSPSVEYASKINLHTTGLNSQQYHKLSEALNITIGENLSNEEDSKNENRDYNINDTNDDSETNNENGNDNSNDENEYNRNDYRSDNRSNKEKLNGLEDNENELIINGRSIDESNSF